MALSDILINISANLAGLTDELNKGNAQLRNFTQGAKTQLESLNSSLDTVKHAAELFIGALTVQHAAEWISQTLESAAAIKTLASQVGITTTALQEYQFAANEVGISQEVFNRGMLALGRNMGSAVEGSKPAIDAFKRLGINLLDVNGKAKTVDQVLPQLAEKIKNTKNPIDQITLAVTAFGDKAIGQKFLPFLKLGQEELAKMAARAHELGLVLSKDFIDKAEATQNSIKLLEDVFQKAFAVGLLGPFVDKFGDLHALATDPVLVDNIKSFATELGKVVRLIVENAPTILKVMGVLAGGAAGARIGGTIGSFAGPEGTATGAFVGGTAGAIAAGLGIQAGENEAERERVFNEAKAAHSNFGTLATEPALPGGPNAGSQPKPTGGGGGGGPDKIAETIAALKLQVQETSALQAAYQGYGDSVETVNRAIDVQNALTRAGVTADSAAGQQIAGLVNTLDEQKAAIEAAKQEQADWNDAMSAGASVTESVRTPLEVYNDTLTDLKQLLDESAISQETFDRAVAKAKTTLDDANQGSSDFAQASKDASEAISTAFEDAIIKGEKLSDVIKALGQTIEQILTRLLITKPLENALSSFLDSGGAGSKGGGIFSSFLNLFGSGGGGGSTLGSVGNLGFGFGSTLGSPSAEGNTITPQEAGKAFPVGEQGPELFVPGVQGRIEPLRGGDTYTINLYPQSDFDNWQRNKTKVYRDLRRTLGDRR